MPACLARFRFVRREAKEISPTEDSGLVRGAMRLIDCLLDEFVPGGAAGYVAAAAAAAKEAKESDKDKEAKEAKDGPAAEEDGAEVLPPPPGEAHAHAQAPPPRAACCCPPCS